MSISPPIFNFLVKSHRKRYLTDKFCYSDSCLYATICEDAKKSRFNEKMEHCIKKCKMKLNINM